MRRAPGAMVILLAGVLLVIWWFRPEPTPRMPAKPGDGNTPAGKISSLSSIGLSNAPTVAAANAVEAANVQPVSASATIKTSTDLAADSGPMLQELKEPSPRDVLENMRAAFRQYAARFHGNPVGTNPEITAALNAGNPKQIQFVNEADGLRINARGELVDSWGTPFFFHQLSATEMEIHSAGPDRKMWTRDDLVLK